MEQATYLGLVASLLGFALAAISPGPNLVAVASAAFEFGRRASLLVVLGLASGALFWSLGMFFGLAKLFSSYPLATIILSYLGGGYMLYLAFKGFRSAFTSGSSIISTTRSYSGIKAWTHGLVVTLTNPKAGLFYASMATFVNNLGVSDAMLFGLAVGFSIEATLLYGVVGLLFSTHVFKAFYDRMSRYFDAAFGCVFAVIGFLMIS